MRLTSDKIAQILSSKVQLYMAIAVGITIGGFIAAGAAFAVGSWGVSPDVIVVAVISLLLLVWLGIGIAHSKTAARCQKLADIITSPGTQKRFDRETGKMVLEKMGTVDIGLGEATPAVIDRVEISLAEAELLAAAINPTQSRMLLGNSSTTPQPRPRPEHNAVDAVIEAPVPSADFTSAATATQS